MSKTRVDKGKLKDTKLQGADLKEAQLQGADLNSAKLHGADLSNAKLQGADLSNAQLQGADLRGAQLQVANLSNAKLQGADLMGAQLKGANLEGVQLQGADLASAEVWLVNFPADLANQSPAPLGLADLENSSLTSEAKAQLIQDLSTDITDPEVLTVVTSRLRNEPPGWADATRQIDYVRTAKQPSAEELAKFHAHLACDDAEGDDDAEGYIATSMAGRAKEFQTKHLIEGYAKAFANAFLENCPGAKLIEETRATLDHLARLPLYHYH